MCAYNDLTPFMKYRFLNLNDPIIQEKSRDWEVDIKIVNIRVGKGKWEDPDSLLIDNQELILLNLVILQRKLDHYFNLLSMQFSIEDDYLDIDKWKKMYKSNNLSMESFYNDVEKKINKAKP